MVENEKKKNKKKNKTKTKTKNKTKQNYIFQHSILFLNVTAGYS